MRRKLWMSIFMVLALFFMVVPTYAEGEGTGSGDPSSSDPSDPSAGDPSAGDPSTGDPSNPGGPTPTPEPYDPPEISPNKASIVIDNAIPGKTYDLYELFYRIDAPVEDYAPVYTAASPEILEFFVDM